MKSFGKKSEALEVDDLQALREFLSAGLATDFFLLYSALWSRSRRTDRRMRKGSIALANGKKSRPLTNLARGRCCLFAANDFLRCDGQKRIAQLCQRDSQQLQLILA